MAPTTDWQSILHGQQFQSLPATEKAKFLHTYVPGFAGLPPQEQTKFLSSLQFGGTGEPGRDIKQGAWGLVQEIASHPGEVAKNAGSELWSQAKGMAEPLVDSLTAKMPHKENMYGMANSPLMAPANAAINWIRRSVPQRTPEGGTLPPRSLPYKMLTAATELAGIPTGAEGQEEEARKGNIPGVAGHAATPMAEAALSPVIGAAGEKAFGAKALETRRVAKGNRALDVAMGTPTTKPAVDASIGLRAELEGMDETRALNIAKPDIIESERRNPLGKSIKTGSDKWFARAANFKNYLTALWENSNNALMARYGFLPIDNDAAVAAGRRFLDVEQPEARESAPNEATAAEKWLQGIDKPRTVASTNRLLRWINKDLDTPKAKEAFGNIGMAVRQRVAEAYRRQIETVLEEKEGHGVRDTNTRYYAGMKAWEQMIDNGLKEARKEFGGSLEKVPEWVHFYMFMHPSVEGLLRVGVGAALSTRRMFRSAPSDLMDTAMKNLTKSKLEPPPVRKPREFPKLPGPGGTSPGELIAPGGTNRQPPGPPKYGYQEGNVNPAAYQEGDTGTPTPSGRVSGEPPRVPTGSGPLAHAPGRAYRVPGSEAIPVGPRTPAPPPQRVGVHEPASTVPLAHTWADVRGALQRVLDDPAASAADKAAARVTQRLLSRTTRTGAAEPAVEAHMAELVKSGKISEGEIFRMVRKGALPPGSAGKIFKLARQ